MGREPVSAADAVAPARRSSPPRLYVATPDHRFCMASRPSASRVTRNTRTQAVARLPHTAAALPVDMSSTPNDGPNAVPALDNALDKDAARVASDAGTELSSNGWYEQENAASPHANMTPSTNRPASGAAPGSKLARPATAHAPIHNSAAARTPATGLLPPSHLAPGRC